MFRIPFMELVGLEPSLITRRIIKSMSVVMQVIA